MSGGQVIGGAVGAVAGFLLGGPTGALYGAQLGLMAGGYLDPPKGPTVNGPRLDDLTVQTSTYGAVIPRVYGTVAVNGNVFWLENNALKETVTKKKSGGKGGGSKTTTRTYTYSATFAVGLCKGPIAGVLRIWIGPDLIYDSGSSDPDTITASNNAAVGFHVYLGTDTQEPDARMQATLGVANTPAWRGLAYIVFYDLELARYGNSLMGSQVCVEVFQLGTYTYYPVTQHDMPAAALWRQTVWNGTIFCRLVYASSTVYTSPDGITWTAQSTAMTYSNHFSGLAYGNGVFVAVNGNDYNAWYSPDAITWTQSYVGEKCSDIAFGAGTFVCATPYNTAYTTSDGYTWAHNSIPYTNSGNDPIIEFNGSVFLIYSQGVGKSCVSSSGTSGWTQYTPPTVSGSYQLVSKAGVFALITDTASWTASDGHTWSSALAGVSGIQSACADNNNFLVFTAGGSSFGHLYTSPDCVSWTDYHTLPGGLNVPMSPCWNGTVIAVVDYGYATAMTIVPFVMSAGPTTLDAIVSAECLQSGLLAGGDIDVTTLTPLVTGYRVSSVGAIRGAIEQLQAAWPFDVVQHGYGIRYVLRSTATSIATIPAADLDARSDGSAPGVQITMSREMDSQLHRRVTVQHLDYDREYNVGTQYAERLNTDAINETVIDLPIVLTATEAAGKAEVLLYLYWLERYDVAVNLPPTYNHVEPGDVVTLVTPDGNVSLRLTAVSYTSDGRVECQAKYASAAIYTPTAVGVSSGVTGPTTITPVGASVYVLLDVPMMGSAQSGPSFLAAMTGAIAGWRGGVLMQSTDTGSTWDILQEFGPPGSSMGTCTNAIGAVESRMIDASSVLAVTMTQGELYSVTLLAMLGGANHFAYGADGRWEILAAKKCTQQSGNSYVLTDLLRGRFGTEWAMGLHAAGDSLILLDTTDVAAIAMGSGTIGLSYLYRGITIDRDISTDSDRSFAYAGVNLKPMSPVYLNGSRDPSSNDWSLEWIRRTRTGGEWRDYVDASLSEDVEAYQIDVYADGSYTTVKRTITASTPYCVYASTAQVIDFGSNQSTLYLKIYQMSAVVGRGYPLTQSITR